MNTQKGFFSFFSSRNVRPAAAAAAFFLLVSVAALVSGGNFLGQTLGAAFVPGGNAADSTEQAGSADERLSDDARSARAGGSLKKMEPLPPEQVGTSTLWLARCIYSETKRPREQELVAWVVRNRVETGYRGNDSYRAVVLDPYQFSAFNPGSRKRSFYTRLDASSQEDGWQRALLIAHQVKSAPASRRPFSKGTRHFFSERSMAGGRQPNWAARGEKVKPERHENIGEDRFRFYENVR
jgi:hypothetical protein